MSKQPEALYLADCIDPPQIFVSPEMRAAAAAELRRLHGANQAMLEALKDLMDGTGDMTSKRIEKARAAIAKGEQS